jgi:hypothetical protein
MYYYVDDNGERKGTTVTLQSFIGNPNHTKDVQVDHINHDSLDNREENLRITNKNQNARNRKSKNSNNITGYRNVAYIPRNGNKPYIVQLMVNGKNKRLKSFSDIDEAGIYAEEMRQKYYGEYAGSN